MEYTAGQYDVPAERARSMHLSMHDGVPVWCDCCSCEAEPYWSEGCDEAAEDRRKPPGTSLHPGK